MNGKPGWGIPNWEEDKLKRRQVIRCLEEFGPSLLPAPRALYPALQHCGPQVSPAPLVVRAHGQDTRGGPSLGRIAKKKNN